MARSATQRLTSVRLDDDQLEKLKVIGESLYGDDDGGSVPAMIRRAIDEFTERELARPDFEERATETLRVRREKVERFLRD